MFPSYYCLQEKIHWTIFTYFCGPKKGRFFIILIKQDIMIHHDPNVEKMIKPVHIDVS